MFVIKVVLISEQMTEHKFRALLDISDKFRSKLNGFSYTTLQC